MKRESTSQMSEIDEKTEDDMNWGGAYSLDFNKC